MTDPASPLELSLSALSALSILQLYNNTNLYFTISSLPPSLVFVQLSHTSLSGPLPSFLSSLTNLFSLDVSSTLVTGPFPTSLSQTCTRQPSGFADADCNVADTPLFLYPCGAGSFEGDRGGNCRSDSEHGKTNWDYLTCLPCPRCTPFGDCTDGFDSYENMCTVCPANTFEVYGSCTECPSDSFAAFLLPASTILSILVIVGIGVALLKCGVVRLPTFSLTLTNMIRLKQIGAAFQILTVFAQLSAVLAPWFLSVAGVFLAISAPVGVQPVCASWFSDLIHGEYYFVRSYLALAALSLLSSLLRYARKVPALKARLSPDTFAKMQKWAALVVLNTPIIVLPLALRPAQMLSSYFDKFHGLEKGLFAAASSGFFLSLVSAAVLIFVLHRTIKATSSQFKVLREEVLEELFAAKAGADTTSTTWEDINKSRPYVAAFCLQYTPCEYQHEEKVVWRKIVSVVGIIAMNFFATGIAEGGCRPEVFGYSQASFQALFVGTNFIYVPHLLRRPYVSHRKSGRMGDPLNDAELL